MQVTLKVKRCKEPNYWISMPRTSTYQLIWKVVLPAKSTEKSFEQILTLVRQRYFPKPSVTMQWLTFNSRSQKRESLLPHLIVIDLWRLSEYCNFGESLAQMLRDRLDCGMNDDRVQHPYWSSPSWPLKNLMSQCKPWRLQTMMLRNSKGRQRPQSTNLTEILSKDHLLMQGQHITKILRIHSCYRCGWKHHSASDCRYVIQSVCFARK